VVRDHVLAGVAELAAAGDDLTFAKVAKASGVPERTVYRHFPDRAALLTAAYEWINRRLGLTGDRPSSADEAVDLVRRSFPGFDEVAPVLRELLVAPEGLLARLSVNDERRAAAVALVEAEAPGLDEADTRRVAAAVQLLTSAAAWQGLRDYWAMDGTEAADAAALAIELLLAGARAPAATTEGNP
jgi:AcrR family transcriptional regulator